MSSLCGSGVEVREERNRWQSRSVCKGSYPGGLGDLPQAAGGSRLRLVGKGGSGEGNGELNAVGQRAKGYCKATLYFSDCERAEYGAWESPTTLRECVDACQGCARCNYVSFSKSNRDCSWFHNCSFSELGQVSYGGGDTYTSVRVKG